MSIQARDGSFRKVQLEVFPLKGAEKLTVRKLSGYYAPRAPASGN